MTVVEMLRQEMPISRTSMAMGVHRSFIYYNRKEHARKRKQRVSAEIVSEILSISLERSTYGYRRTWAMLRNSGIRVNVKTVRRIMQMNNLSLPYAKHKNRTRMKDLAKPDDINRLWETDIHYIGTAREGTDYLMSIKDCFSKKWISYELSRTCTAKDAIRAVEKACAIRFSGTSPAHLMLRTDNGPQYIANVFLQSVKLMGIGQEYIQKQTPEDNGDIESFHSSIKTDYIWPNELETFNDVKELMEFAFTDYNTVRPHSSIGYLPPDEFEKRWIEDEEFRNKFLEERKRKEERKMRNMQEKRRRLKENVSLEDRITVRN